MISNDSRLRLLINNIINTKINRINRNAQSSNKEIEALKKSVEQIQDLIVTDGDGTKYLSDDGSYKTLVLENGSDVDENIALIVTQNQEAIKTLNGTGVGSVEYKIIQAFAITEIVE